MYTRADYMDHRCTFQQYYGEIAQEIGLNFTQSGLLSTVKTALAAGDEHLNSIPLATWDRYADGFKNSAVAALKRRGDGWSLAGGVCIAKAAAVAAAEEPA